MNDKTQAPEGFQEFDLDWTEVPSIDWAQDQEVRGVVAGGRYAEYERRGKPIISGILKLNTDTGSKLLWESYQLREFMARCRLGDEILVRATGQVSLGSGNKMNTFQAFVKPAKDRAQRTPALGMRPEPRLPAAQGTFPGMDKPGQTIAREPDFDDDIPF